ncbi:ATP-dependent DNA helicase PIF1 [Coprinopsis cinerea AmutBmut pab1-1]|nr:ATP-dependent DNA helicase PIF1 [Coprinopsis cinerea AmutBmut pab1-1]
MEIGSPMASLYLLGNPDHYTSHTFTPFFWKKYVTKVKADWALSAQDDSYKDALQNYENEKVLLEVQDGEVKSRTLVDDYTHRPKVYEDVPLYDWMLYVKKRRIPEKRRKKKDLEEQTLEEGSDDEPDLESSQRYMRFLEGHPQYNSHEVYCDFTRTDLPILNWLGGVVPRRDQGDREYYCLVMLAIFKPWRSGLNLKDESQLWDEAFAEHKFQAHFLNVMDNLNLRYECLDAKDDFFAQLKKRKNALKNSLPYFQGDIGSYEQLEEYDDAYLDALAADVDEYGHMQDGYMLGYRRRAKLLEMEQAEDMISRTGWLEGLGIGSDTSKERGHGTLKDFEECVVTNESDGSHWKAIVKDQRAQVLAKKRKHAPAVPQNERGKARWGAINDVCILDASYLLQNFTVPKEETKKIINDTVNEYSLNKEQERAFKIVANHAACLAPKQLLMYLGGMGGTGKSQVIKSLISMFEKKRESHRFIVLAPTGTAAALLNGSTYHSMLGVRPSKNSDDALTRNEQTKFQWFPVKTFVT